MAADACADTMAEEGRGYSCSIDCSCPVVQRCTHICAQRSDKGYDLATDDLTREDPLSLPLSLSLSLCIYIHIYICVYVYVQADVYVYVCGMNVCMYGRMCACRLHIWVHTKIFAFARRENATHAVCFAVPSHHMAFLLQRKYGFGQMAVRG